MKRAADRSLESEEDEDSEDSSESGGWSDEESDQDELLEDLPTELFLRADEILDQLQHSNDVELVGKARQALVKSRILLFALHPEHKEMSDKALQRSDGKVPPGSSLVQRTLLDRRFLLSQVSLALAKVEAISCLDPSNQQSIQLLRESLVFFPRCVEALYLLALALKPLASDSTKMDEVESLLRKAAATTISSPPGFPGSSSSTTPMPPAASLEEDIIFLHRCTKAAAVAQQALALLLLQSGRASDAAKHLIAQKFKWRLSSEVLNYSAPSSLSSTPLTSTPLTLHSDRFVQCLDDVFGAEALEELKRVYRQQSPYWLEHSYDLASNSSRHAGYVSYLYPLHNRRAMCSIEQIIDSIFQVARVKFPQCSSCSVAEWWVHSRHHCAGHQLHFDSDETQIESGGAPHHPLVSAVLFVSDDEPSSVGGPTLVTNQTLSGNELATLGWLCHPKQNRLCLFDAQCLHGVIPGKGPNPALESRRLTFMVGFWDKITAQDRGVDSPGPGQCFPEAGKTRWTWPAEMALRPGVDYPLSSAPERLSKATPISVSSVWELIVEDAKTGNEAGARVGAGGSGALPSYNSCFMGF